MKLTIYDFHKIMTDISALHISNYRQDKNWHCPEKGKSFIFNWEWHEYSGFGMVCLLNGIVDGSNEFCKESFLSIGSKSRKQAENKHVSEIYNEPALTELLQYIADNHKLLY